MKATEHARLVREAESKVRGQYAEIILKLQAERDQLRRLYGEASEDMGVPDIDRFEWEQGR